MDCRKSELLNAKNKMEHLLNTFELSKYKLK